MRKVGPLEAGLRSGRDTWLSGEGRLIGERSTTITRMPRLRVGAREQHDHAADREGFAWALAVSPLAATVVLLVRFLLDVVDDLHYVVVNVQDFLVEDVILEQNGTRRRRLLVVSGIAHVGHDFGV